MSSDTRDRPRVGLILSGGGARAAYQCGVLRAIGEMLPRGFGCPFRIITGASAGAINGTVVATNARHYREGVRRLCGVWSNFSVDKVFRTDVPSVARNALHWVAAFVSLGLGPGNPRSLLDNSPLRELLENHVLFPRIGESIAHGALDALALTASGYGSARAVTFFHARPGIPEWRRARREGRSTEIGLDHLMASIAMPFVFPPVRIGGEFFGDGALRDAAPLSSAIHLGAERLLVVGVRDEETPAPSGVITPSQPTIGQIAGYMLDALFLDALYSDLERLARINRMLLQTDTDLLRASGEPLRQIETYIIVPSKDVREIAQRHAVEFPRTVRLLLRGVGALNTGGRQLISYLLFEGGFCRELIELGYHDAMAQKDTLLAFLVGEPVPPITAPRHLKNALGSHADYANEELSVS